MSITSKIQSLAQGINTKTGIVGDDLTEMIQKLTDGYGGIPTEKSGSGLVTFGGGSNRRLGYAKFEGKCEQSGTPTPDAPIAVKCNNSKWQASGKNIAHQNITNAGAYQQYDIFKDLVTTTNTITWDDLRRSSSIGKTATFSCDIAIHSDFEGALSIYPYQLNGLNLDFVSIGLGHLKENETRHVTATGEITLKVVSENYSKGSIFFYPSNAADRVSGKFTVSNIQLEFNDHETAYEPYINNGTVDLSSKELRGIGDVKDEYDAQAGMLTRRIGKVDLGTLNWVYHPISARYSEFFDCYIDDIKKGNSSIVSKLISDAGFTPIASGAIATAGNDNNVMAVAHNATRIIICCPSYSEASSFKSAMSGIYLYYELETPTAETIAPQQLSQIKGANTILQTSGDVPNSSLTIECYTNEGVS